MIVKLILDYLEKGVDLTPHQDSTYRKVSEGSNVLDKSYLSLDDVVYGSFEYERLCYGYHPLEGVDSWGEYD